MSAEHDVKCNETYAEALLARSTDGDNVLELLKRTCVCIEQPAPVVPQQNAAARAVDCPPELAGQGCFICKDEPGSEVFYEEEPVIIVPTDQGELHQHALCFYVQRSENLERSAKALRGRVIQLQGEVAMLKQRGDIGIQTLAAVLGKTGRVRLHKHNYERAKRAEHQIDFRDEEDGARSVGLKGAADIKIAREMPKV